jgi:sugar-specific transcriptional regulator TrmB
MELEVLLKSFGLSDKEIAVYLALVQLGPSPVRTVGTKANINRGTTYDILRALMDEGLVTYYHKQTKQYFIAEPPEKLLAVLDRRQEKLVEMKRDVLESLPQLQAVYEKSGNRPVVKYYEGTKGMQQILQDVLEVMKLATDKTYYVYSSGTADDRRHLYAAMPDFNKKRMTKNIAVKVISLGAGGETSGLDERKQLEVEASPSVTMTHEIMYSNRIAHIGHNVAGNSIGVVIENESIYQMQRAIFESLWSKL